MIRLRRATAADALAIANVHVRSWQAAYRGIMPDAFLDGLDAVERASRYRLEDGDPGSPATMVAIADIGRCGFSTTGPSRDADAPASGELLALYIDPDAWGLGIGRQLLVEARQHLVTHGYNEAILWVLEGNDRARSFYERDGWALDGNRRTEDVWGIRVDVARYCRALR